MIPALMVMLLTMLCGFLPALNIVAEKEAHEETAQVLSNTQFLVDRGKDTIAGLQNNLADAQATVASMEIELERLRALEEKVSAFTATIGS